MRGRRRGRNTSRRETYHTAQLPMQITDTFTPSTHRSPAGIVHGHSNGIFPQRGIQLLHHESVHWTNVGARDDESRFKHHPLPSHFRLELSFVSVSFPNHSSHLAGWPHLVGKNPEVDWRYHYRKTSLFFPPSVSRRHPQSRHGEHVSPGHLNDSQFQSCRDLFRRPLPHTACHSPAFPPKDRQGQRGRGGHSAQSLFCLRKKKGKLSSKENSNPADTHLRRRGVLPPLFWFFFSPPFSRIRNYGKDGENWRFLEGNFLKCEKGSNYRKR